MLRDPRGETAPQSTDLMVSFRWCLKRGLVTRPHYLWGLLFAAHTALPLKIPSVTSIEFGVAGGNGLLALEQAAKLTTELTGVGVQVFGFDTGTGMPPPADHRDVPWGIRQGYFPMDEQALRARLTTAELVLGPVADTVPAWAAQSGRPPIGFISFDLDYHSSTVQALGLLDGPSELLLPRVACYFDDLFGYGWSDFNGERAAIAEFNEAHAQRKIGKIHGLRYELPLAVHAAAWHEQLYLAHLFDHPLYNVAAPAPTGPEADAFFAAHQLAPE
jgi:hypothetical protein